MLRLLRVFLAIWWAWVNYTWFAAASAYERHDVVYRLLAFTFMARKLMLAAVVPDLFDTGHEVLVAAAVVPGSLIPRPDEPGSSHQPDPAELGPAPA